MIIVIQLLQAKSIHKYLLMCSYKLKLVHFNIWLKSFHSGKLKFHLVMNLETVKFSIFFMYL